jgi:hypothetical protein
LAFGQYYRDNTEKFDYESNWYKIKIQFS